MRRGVLIGFVALVMVGAALAVPVRAQDERPSWTAILAAANEVPSVDTNARGVAIFHLSDDGMSIEYKLIAANIVDVLMAHIHVGDASTAGGVVVWLYPSAPPPSLIEGRFQGVLAEGTITASSFVGALAGMSLSVLLERMDASTVYVNVHTNANPGGEIRGQIAPAD